ncbi:GIY-YIG nuclease family protein [Dialister micraerophilus]|jgi:hypothetical protein|nr:GIY-YIG nuclease family protein [Dialister micraerophilus]MDK8285538.1 GIY-YIG nuclease family protein [Dialister micraerophilus]MDU5300859.1 GIY-YIG nuclease family protein [Dialister micraerophilus]
MVLKTMKEKKYFTYMLRCCDNSLYSGYTTDLQKRLETHNEGKGAKYTRSRLPVTLVWYKEWKDEHTARSEEIKMKRLTKEQKEEKIKKFGKATE